MNDYEFEQLRRQIHKKMKELNNLQWKHRVYTGQDYVVSGKLPEPDESTTKKELVEAVRETMKIGRDSRWRHASPLSWVSALNQQLGSLNRLAKYLPEDK